VKPTAVLGAGSWGTALAIHLANAGHGVRLWARDAALVEELDRARINARYLPGVTLPGGVEPTSSLGAALDGAAFVVIAVPSHGLRAVVRSAASHVEDRAVLVSATKGLDS
jgi:glycerol-3-phosphate dehydrogenase (NAD(P)+)